MNGFVEKESNQAYWNNLNADMCQKLNIPDSGGAISYFPLENGEKYNPSKNQNVDLDQLQNSNGTKVVKHTKDFPSKYDTDRVETFKRGVPAQSRSKKVK